MEMAKYALKEQPRVPYSPSEQEVFVFLARKPGGRTTKELTELFYNGKKERPFNGHKSVVGMLRSIQRKARLNKEPFKVCATARSGPIPMTYWLED